MAFRFGCSMVIYYCWPTYRSAFQICFTFNLKKRFTKYFHNVNSSRTRMIKRNSNTNPTQKRIN